MQVTNIYDGNKLLGPNVVIYEFHLWKDIDLKEKYSTRYEYKYITDCLGTLQIIFKL